MQHASDSVEGGCLCGAVRYRVDGVPIVTSICHCWTCRRASGAPSVAWVVLRANDFTLVKGRPARFRSTPPVVRTFCAACGTPLTYQHDHSPDTIDVTTATLDSPARFAPTREVWTEHRIAWQPLSENLPHFRRGSSGEQDPGVA